MDEMFRPPVNRAMRVLDRSFFRKTLPISAARVQENQNISKVRKQLEQSRDALMQERLGTVHPDPDPEMAKAGKKCILLKPEVTASAADGESDSRGEHREPQSSTIAALVHEQLVSIIPYDLNLDYDYWTYHDIISSVLPEDEQDEIPSGFTQVGHVAHLNLREAYFPYKRIIAEILLDKNPTVRTVINKIDDVGEESEFRTFKYEVLAGPDDLNVTISEENCAFKFDYAKVYWNSRLQTEHRRLVSTFKEGENVCDVMAGIGPFAVPAGKKRVFVWANDLNPDSYVSLEDAIKRNKVGDFVKPFNQDGRTFIRGATTDILNQPQHKVEILKKLSRKAGKDAKPEVIRSLVQPKTFQHFVLNLPASAITFLSSFVGLYPSEKKGEVGQLPLVHCYCFSTKSDDNVEEGLKICEEISAQLGYEMVPGKIDEAEGNVEIYDVRDVAPKKRMFCASFRLPQEVAFQGS
ncbi:hypothetical protein K431DRAFT_283264 [Polychaeton citri CBS 116435]|uniref:tRNA (guanine(37)-N1)-methyltransferase n=1 Tax=Polychaeton citri CBS 116435 TaxID=1314669 RepID=A0A9P4QE98_9PEZI|nr:hypothetical protein K431DRAFT_283264 [Polychaeton citri CBS 116435]